MAHPDKPHLDRVPKRWKPSIWASKKPFGIGEQHPNNFAEITRAIRENKDELPFAWRIINEGVCDGCALGVAGLKDWTTDGPHLCNIRLRLLRQNTMPALDIDLLADIEPLRKKKSADLRELGRLPYPMIRRTGDKGFRRISWDEALDLTADRIKSSSPDRLGFYLTGRGTVNETYYAAQKAVRALGTNSIDNAARICHAPSSVALKQTIGVGATTCSYSDWIGTDLLVFIGANPANNQPVTTKYLHYAKKAGTNVVLVNPYREPGMERYWVPSIPESALFGTKIANDTFLVTQGGDIAFLCGALKHILERDLIDHAYIAEHTTGYPELKAEIAAMSWQTLESNSGLSEQRMREFGQLIGAAKTAVFVWSMGVTQHSTGEDGVRAIVNLALTKGFVGRDLCGLMPIRGHSGIQGGAEMGAYSTTLPGNIPISAESAAALSKQWGFEVPATKGMITSEMIDAADRGELDVLFAAGSNFLEVLPDPAYIDQALGKIALRVHQDIVLSSQMFIDPADTVILLPAATRYETPGGVTQRSTERRVMFSPEIAGRRIGEARPEWEIFLDLARRVRPDLRMQLSYPCTQQIREEIAQVVPAYDGIQHLCKTGDHFQAGGKHLCENWNFPTGDGKAHFIPVQAPDQQIPDGKFHVSTRRGKQFNSMIHAQKDAITGSTRDAVFMSAADAKTLHLSDGDPVILRNDNGTYRGSIQIVPIAKGNLQVMWPEGNVLLHRTKRSPESGVPDYNAYVTVEKASASSLAAD
jgi:molybdopterin-dependent oxidoreductase alpha subunit